MSRRSVMQRVLLAFLLLQQLVDAFVVLPSTSSSNIAITKTAALPSPTLTTAVSTVDPTTFLSDVLGGVLGTPIILAVPILAALGVASLVAYAIVAYASPAADDDE